MSAVKAAEPTTSPVPVKEDDGLGPFSGKDFSDPQVRLEALAVMASTFQKTTTKTHTFSSCCGSRVAESGNLLGFGRLDVDGRQTGQYVMVDGTYESALKAYDEVYSKDFFEKYKAKWHRAHLYDPKYYELSYGAAQAAKYAENNRKAVAGGYVVANKVNLIFSWNLTADEAIKKWYTSEEFSKHAKGMDFNDPVDGKASLIWKEEP